MKRFILIALLAAKAAFAATITLTFEDLPDANFLNNPNGQTNIGNFYASSGVSNFGMDVEGLSVSRFGGYNSAAFPPQSGDVTLTSNGFDFATITFSQLVSSVGLWYVSTDNITLTAFDGSQNILKSVAGAPDSDGVSGTNLQLSVSAAHIASITLGYTGGANLFTFDDLSFTQETSGGAAAPEPSTAVGIALICLGFWRKQRCQAAERSPGRTAIDSTGRESI